MLDQRLQQRMQQKLSPQQIQVIKLLEIPTTMLEQRIKAEIEENPALDLDIDDDNYEPEDMQNDESDDYSDDEFDSNNDSENSSESDDYDSDSPTENEPNISDEDNILTKNDADEFSINDYFDEDEYSNYKFQTNNYSKDQENKYIQISDTISLNEQLMNQIQLCDFSEREQMLAEYIIGNLDEDGYLRRDLINISDDLVLSQGLDISETELESVLIKIQKLDPAGIGARNLRECLLLQLERKQQTVNVRNAIAILENCFEEFTKKHYEKIQQRLSIDAEKLKNAIDEILQLNPKPGNSETTSNSHNITETVTPDFLLDIVDGELDLTMNNKNIPNLKISPEFTQMIDEYQSNKTNDKEQRQAISFIKQKIESANWFIDAIRQRHKTLLSTMWSIIGFQKEFFMTGDETKLRPMILQDIAEVTGLDVSTVSRVTNGKFIQTPFGSYQLKYFFSEGMQNSQGEEVSSREIKTILKEAIDNEDKSHPMTDDELTNVLKKRGYEIARRTVAKYREQLGIRVGRLRKEL